MTSEVKLEPARSVSLYELEHNLCAFAGMADDVDDPELRAEAELGTTLRSAKDKRDRVVAFLRHCESRRSWPIGRSSG